MPTKRILSAVLATALLGSATFLAAQGVDDVDPVAGREEAMKKVGSAAGIIGKMLKGEEPFSATRANAAFAEMQFAMQDFDTLFPKGTAGEGETQFAASETIWEDPHGFETAVHKFQKDIGAAVQYDAMNQQQVASVFGDLAKNCQSCHEKYRVKK